MGEMPVEIIEQLRLALLNDLRMVADQLQAFCSQVETALANQPTDLEPLQYSFLDVATKIQVGIRLHERLGWPGEPITHHTRTMRKPDEYDLALETLIRYRLRLVTELLADDLELTSKTRVIDRVQLITGFLRDSGITPSAATQVQPIA